MLTGDTLNDAINPLPRRLLEVDIAIDTRMKRLCTQRRESSIELAAGEDEFFGAAGTNQPSQAGGAAYVGDHAQAGFGQAEHEIHVLDGLAGGAFEKVVDDGHHDDACR